MSAVYPPNQRQGQGQDGTPFINPGLTVKPTSYFAPKPPPPIYQNNPVFEHFAQPDNGFGVSNFRVEEALPESINRTSTDFQLEDIQQYQNPLGSFQFQRHANFLFREHYGDYRLIDQEQVPDDYIYWDIIKTFQERNPLMDFFFSKRNLDHLQKLIIEMVRHQSMDAYHISRQSDNELLTIMRAQYIQTPTNPFAEGKAFISEVCKLNKNVLDFAVPKVLVSIQSTLGYIRDQGNTTYPPPQPEFLSNTGNRINASFGLHFI